MWFLERPLETRTLGNSDLEISILGLGAWAIGGGGWEYGWGSQDDGDSVAAIHRALELGINWIDTAAVYGLGHSEEVVARAVASWPGPRPLIFTKCGLRWDEKGNVFRKIRPDSIREECEQSLRRLRVDAIDLYQIHWPRDIAQIEAAWKTMVELKSSGKVRWIGVCNFDVPQLLACETLAPVTSLQPPYSLISRAIETAILPHCRERGIGTIVYSPMVSGLLSGTMTPERIAGLPDDDWRKRDREFREPNLARNLALVERLRAVGSRRGRSPGEVAIAWTLRHPAVTAAIVGARHPRQVEGVVGAAGLALTDAEASALTQSQP